MQVFKTLKAYFLVLLMLILTGGGIRAIKIADLQNVLKPDAITAYGDKLYIIEDTTIKIFKLPNVELVKSFGKKGEGPGEFKFRPILRVYPDYLLANSSGKVLFFTHDGDYLREAKIQGHNSRFLTLRENFAGRKNSFDRKSNTATQVIGVYDNSFKFIKEVYKAPMPGMMYISSNQKEKQDYLLIRDYINYETHHDKLFICDTSKGFYFTVFDDKGTKLYEINREYKKVKIPDSYKKKAIEKEKAQPWMKRFKDVFNFVFPENFPPFRFFFHFQ